MALAWVASAGVIAFLVVRGQWVLLVLTLLLMPVYAYGAWRDGKPLWPGGPSPRR